MKDSVVTKRKGDWKAKGTKRSIFRIFNSQIWILNIPTEKNVSMNLNILRICINFKNEGKWIVDETMFWILRTYIRLRHRSFA